ncbi:hypothetical protein N7448_001508 [Penicillium atrosanguineum]|uniref:Uncharacterized protein n=1 Tax=Penicillium atrosanguineum TaxID=1132637 RepID=A0A9W9HK92_9EURO|nr:uncharacterized protein N7443_004906 [Penicillium atrosanguineum]KAJ5133464.1 hypothetical protein N7526_004829 [Penicillium atrosanguineum]KAJ5149930.1 hypothetical protein N7448_001508 [Penicillium atrosanguineum]KAJ5305246.1 hypothetical protein N7443_004906 [Penicillium atrosanguineum]KAJ5324710.1 hypothetical protein N7476_003310 [Penicillium atrosanguineum]
MPSPTSRPSDSKPSDPKPSSFRSPNGKPPISKHSWNSKQEHNPTFEQDRESFYKSLMHRSRLINREPEKYMEIAQYLTKVAREFDKIKQLADISQGNGRDVPLCFPARCDMIKEEMQKLSQGLTSRSLPPALGSLLIEMLAIHSGRLTLDGSSTAVDLSQALERKIGSNQFDWKRRNKIDRKGQLIVRYAHQIFVRLNQAVPRCQCLQCVRRTLPGVTKKD